MNATVNESCIGCGLCQKECKKDAIHVVDGVAVVDGAGTQDEVSARIWAAVEPCFR